MGISDFIKKIFGSEEIKEVEPEKVNFANIGNWIEKEKKELNEREEDVFVLIREKLDIFFDLFEKKANIAKNVNLDLKKAEERLKLISLDGRDKYLEALENLIDNLNKLEKVNLERFSNKVDKLFLDFNKSTNKNYERATILIGKEMAAIKETLKIFSKDLIKIFGDNKEIIESLDRIYFVESKLKEFSKVDNELKEVKKSNDSLNKKLFEKEEENKKILEQIEETKKSEEYTENLSKQDKIKLDKEDLEKEISNLKQIIDFKELANFYHIFEDKMELVKSYRENFQREFNTEKGKNILISLLNESKLNNEKISNKIKEIGNKRKEIEKTKQEIKPDETQKLYSQTTKMLLDIGSLKNDISKLEKRRENLNTFKEELIKSIENKLKDLGLILEE